MHTKPLLSGAALIEIERDRYDELLHEEAELYLLQTALERSSDYSSVGDIKKYFLPPKEENKESEEK